MAKARRWPTGPRTIFWSDELAPATLAAGRREGRIVQVAPGVWTGDTASDPARVVAANLWAIVARFCPDAVVVDRTAARGGAAEGGIVTIATDARASDLQLPGVRVRVRGRVAHPSDTPWTHGLTCSAPARTLVDNLTTSRARGGRPGRTLTRSELTDWLAAKRLGWGDARFAALIADAGAIAADLGHDPAEVVRLAAGLSDDGAALDGAGFARAVREGTAWDGERLRMFERAADDLAGLDPPALPAPPVDGELPLFEAYFSNYIEGTEFTIDEARRIVETQEPPAMRSADGHDILGTHRCVVDPIGRAVVGVDPDEVVDLLRTRHATVMVGRPDIGPGVFKTQPNRAGSTQFVEPTLVVGTLLRALAATQRMAHPFARAAYVMAVTAEVHPFTDGNGRAARLMMNAELSAAGLCRIVIPTVLRNEYVAALRRFSSNGGDTSALVHVLEHAWRWTAAMPWHDRAATEGQLEATNAVMDSNEAAAAGLHLTVP